LRRREAFDYRDCLNRLATNDRWNEAYFQLHVCCGVCVVPVREHVLFNPTISPKRGYLSAVISATFLPNQQAFRREECFPNPTISPKQVSIRSGIIYFRISNPSVCQQENTSQSPTISQNEFRWAEIISNLHLSKPQVRQRERESDFKVLQTSPKLGLLPRVISSTSAHINSFFRTSEIGTKQITAPTTFGNLSKETPIDFLSRM
jgi:hypothetical protein